MSKRATIVVDLQRDYLGTGRMPLSGIDAAVANAARVIEASRNRGEPVVHVRHEFTGPDAPFFAAGSEGAEIIPDVAPLQGEAIVTKHFPNSFRESALKQVLDEAGVGQVVIVGAMSHMCIDATARAAADLGYEVTVVHDACATCDLEFGDTRVPADQAHATLMSALAFAYAKVVPTHDHIG